MNLPLTISELRQALLRKKYNTVHLVDEYLKRIKSYDNSLNSFLTVAESEAYKRAKKADETLDNLGEQAFKEYPLLGVVVAHKDLFLTKGIRTTAGSKVLENYYPQYSSTVVERVDESGAITIGKLNCDAWAHGASGENSDFGATKNPWNKEHVPGGSSSGSAVSVAANFCMVSTGTDTGGSIRQPANFCGVFGLKPTYGAVSRYGVVAMSSSLDSVGHFARCTKDIETFFDVTKGVDGKDGTLKDFSKKVSTKKKFRLGIPKEYFIDGLDKEVGKAVLSAVEVFKKEGVEIVNVSLPHTKYAISVYYIVQPAEVSSNLGRYDGIRYGESRKIFGDEAKRRIMLGTYVLSAGYYDAYYLHAMKVRSKIIQDFNKVFEKVDAIIAPVSPTPAFKLGEKASDPLQMYLADILTVAGNLAGIPGLSIPYKTNKAGLPLGFQLLGPKFSEYDIFSLGKLFERATSYEIVTPTL